MSEAVYQGDDINKPKPTWWVIENWAKETSYTELADAIKAEGHILHELKDFVKADWERFGELNNFPVIFQGSIGMAKLMRETLPNHTPVAWLNSPKFLCSSYYSHFGKHLFNDYYAMMSLSELVRNKFHFYGIFGKEAQLFVRPDSGEKTFQAQLIDIQDIDKFADQNQDELHKLVLVSTPKNIRGEYRFVVSQDGVIAHSTYRYQGLITKIPFVPKGALKKAEEILAVGYHPDPVYCIDIAEDGDGNFWLLELTSFSSAGLYATDKKAIVNKVSEIAHAAWRKSLTQSQP